MASWIDEVSWNADGLVPALAQDAASGELLTLAWMNREALERTAESGYATYWSRSRKRLWKKGETSGHVQRVVEVRLDCDADAVLLRVESVAGIACHTGRRRCFFSRLEGEGSERRWVVTDPVIADPHPHPAPLPEGEGERDG
jgi:phosphoribosyl-AMP cyclohydrolase